MDTYEAHEARFAEWYGWRPSKAQPCPRAVVGKQCQQGPKECVCHHLRHPIGAFKHARMWLDKDGRHVFTSESYTAKLEDLVDLHTKLAALGVSITVTGRSPWHEWTFMVIIKPA